MLRRSRTANWGQQKTGPPQNRRFCGEKEEQGYSLPAFPKKKSRSKVTLCSDVMRVVLQDLPQRGQKNFASRVIPKRELDPASRWWCERRDLNPYGQTTRTLNVRVYQFRHSRILTGFSLRLFNYSTSAPICQYFFQKNFIFSGNFCAKFTFDILRKKVYNNSVEWQSA